MEQKLNQSRIGYSHFKMCLFLMQKSIEGSILNIFIKSRYKRPSFRSYNKMTIVRVKPARNIK